MFLDVFTLVCDVESTEASSDLIFVSSELPCSSNLAPTLEYYKTQALK